MDANVLSRHPCSCVVPTGIRSGSPCATPSGASTAGGRRSISLRRSAISPFSNGRLAKWHSDRATRERPVLPGLMPYAPEIFGRAVLSQGLGIRWLVSYLLCPLHRKLLDCPPDASVDI